MCNKKCVHFIKERPSWYKNQINLIYILGLKEATENLVEVKKKKKNKQSPWEEYLEKKKQKKRKKKRLNSVIIVIFEVFRRVILSAFPTHRVTNTRYRRCI